MKRDMDLIRKILLEMENRPFTGGWIELDMQGYDNNIVSYHVMLLYDAGLVEATNVSSHTSIAWKPQYITWAGHEFLDAARDNNRWENAKKIVTEKGGSLVFDVLKSVLIQLMTKAVMG